MSARTSPTSHARDGLEASRRHQRERPGNTAEELAGELVELGRRRMVHGTAPALTISSWRSLPA